MEQTNKSPLSVLIIAKYEPTFDWVQLTLEEQHYTIKGRVDTVEQALKKTARTHVDIILADTSGGGVLQTSWIQEISIQFPGILTLIIATSTEMNFVREAMFSGAQGFLLKPFDLPELSKSIEQVHQLWLQRHDLLAKEQNGPKKRKAYAISVFSPKGGTGVTTLAVNLAIALKQKTNAPVLLVDADLSTADVDVFLNVFSEHSIVDLIKLDQAIDHELLEQVTTEHLSGIKILQGDAKLQFIDSPIEPGQMSEMIEELKGIWDGYIVINTGNSLDRWTVEILDTVDTVLITTTPELPAIRAVRNFLELADARTDQSGKWQLIMNAYQNQKTLRMSDIEESIQYPIKITIAQDRELVADSINRGSPFLLSHNKSNISKDIMLLAEQFINGNSASRKSEMVKKDDDIVIEQPKRKRISFRQLFINTLRVSQKADQTAG